MKRTLSILIILLLCFSIFVGCEKQEDKITYSGEMVIEPINLSVEAMTESQLILDLLNSGEWIDDLCKCRCEIGRAHV